ncbi:MAG: CHAT domain-containing protein [Bacteroidetes bacterium]|nr:CHAT domain-containing protein [Bacteroidota bacterium]
MLHRFLMITLFSVMIPIIGFTQSYTELANSCDLLMEQEKYLEACDICLLAKNLAWETHLGDTIRINAAIFAGNAYFFAGKYQETEEMYVEALTLCKQITKDAAWIFDITYGLVHVTDVTKNLDLQLEMTTSAIALSKQLYGSPNEYEVELYQTLSSYYANLGDYNTSDKYLEQAFDTYEALGFGKDAGYANLMVFYAGNLFSVGKYSACVDACIAAIEIYKNTPGYASALCSTFAMEANCYFSNGEAEQSMNVALEGVAYLDSLETPEEIMSNAMMFALLVINVDLQQGTTIADETGLLEALKIGIAFFDTLQYSDPNNLINANIGIGNYYIQKQEWDSVRLYYSNALNNTLKYFGRGDIIYMYCQTVLASSSEHLNDFDTAEKIYLDIIDYSVDFLKSNFLFVSEVEKEYLLGQFTSTHNNFLYFLKQHQNEYPQLKTVAAETDLFLRGLLLKNITSLRNNFLQYGSADDIQTFNTWLAVRQQAASVSAQNPSLATQLESQAEQMEKKFPDTLKAMIKSTDLQTWNSLETSLKSDEAIIQFIDIDNSVETGYFRKDYIALITIPGSTDPEYVYLCNSDQLNTILQRRTNENDRTYVQRIYGFPDPDFPEDTLYYQGDKLYALLWKPMEIYLQQSTTIYYSAAGIINQIAMHALPINKNTCVFNKYLLLLQTNVGDRITESTKPFSSVLLAGGINYESATLVDDDAYLALAETDTDISRGDTWKALPGTLTEVQEIAADAKENNLATKIYKGSSATEKNIKDAAGNYDVIHIATHGYFFADADTSVTDLNTPGYSYRHSKNPLMRSGIILAGGNNTWINGVTDSTQEDGILTAYEISNLNLLNTQLVVLSACETGLGDVQGTEGVYGLQRAFRMAGAKQLLVSLWKIPDQYTAEFMQLFYTALLNGDDAQTSLYKARIAMQKKTDAYNWAAFELVQ